MPGTKQVLRKHLLNESLRAFSPLLTGAQVHDQMAIPVDALGCLHRKPCVLHTRLHQQGCPHHRLIHQEMVLHEGQGFIRGGALQALKGKEADQVSFLLPSTHPLPLPSLPPPWLISFASFPLGSPHFRMGIKAGLGTAWL